MHDTRPRPRVLLGNLEPMMQLGMSRLLADGGMDVVTDEADPREIVAEAGRLLPDAVVLSFDGRSSRELGEQVRAAAPDAKVILYARDETEMEILDPGSSVPRHVDSGGSHALLTELNATSVRREGE